MAIYKRVEAIRKKFKNTISSRMAASILAAEMGIDVYKLLTDKEELKELRNLLKATPHKLLWKRKELVNQMKRNLLVSVGR